MRHRSESTMIAALLLWTAACGAPTATASTDDSTSSAGGRGPERVVVATEEPRTAEIRQLPPMSLDDSEVRTTTEVDWEADSLFPYQQWPDVVGVRRGIVMSAGAQPWGAGIMWARGFDVSDSRTEYRFYAERSSAYAVYFSSPDRRGENPIVWNTIDAHDDLGSMPSAMFHHDTPNHWGLHRRAHLVEVDALRTTSNNGGLHFVIRSARVLDATPEYALVVEDALTQLRARFDRARSTSAHHIERLLTTGRARAPAGYERVAPEGPTIAVLPTWLDSERRMEVVYIARYREVHLGPEQTRMTQCPPCPCDARGRCAPCARCDPREETFRDQVTAGYEMAARYGVTHDGRLASETIMAAKAY